jgi:hypothetical protein
MAGVGNDDSGAVGGSGGEGNENVMGVDASDGKQIVSRGDDGGGWRCHDRKGRAEVGLGDMDVGDAGGGEPREERTRLFSSLLSVKLTTALNSLSRSLCGGRCKSGRCHGVGHTRLIMVFDGDNS